MSARRDTGTGQKNSCRPNVNHDGPPRARGDRPGSNKIRPPSHLRPETAAWWATVVGDYALETHHLRLLTLAAEAWDRGVEAREAIAKHGSVYLDRFQQPRARPEVAIERDSRIAFARLVRELALDVDGPEEPGRPPRIAGRRAAIDEADRRILGID